MVLSPDGELVREDLVRELDFVVAEKADGSANALLLAMVLIIDSSRRFEYE